MQGRVMEVYKDSNQVLVSGVNAKVRYLTKQRKDRIKEGLSPDPEGFPENLTKLEKPISVHSVQLVDPQDGKKKNKKKNILNNDGWMRKEGVRQREKRDRQNFWQKCPRSNRKRKIIAEGGIVLIVGREKRAIILEDHHENSLSLPPSPPPPQKKGLPCDPKMEGKKRVSKRTGVVIPRFNFDDMMEGGSGEEKKKKKKPEINEITDTTTEVALQQTYFAGLHNIDQLAGLMTEANLLYEDNPPEPDTEYRYEE